MNIEEQNREALIAYFEKSGHPITNKVLGVEIEHFILVSDANEPITYDSKDGRIGIADVLNALTDHYPAIFLNNEGEIIGCANEPPSRLSQLLKLRDPLPPLPQYKRSEKSIRISVHALMRISIGIMRTCMRLVIIQRTKRLISS